MMIRRSMSRRPGLSLLEVVVGFGIMGIAVPCVITLFPFSALTLSSALQNDRAATCAVTADGTLRDIHRGVVEANGGGEIYFGTMDAAIPPYPQGVPIPLFPGIGSPAPDEPSFPVVIDPMGYYARAGTLSQTQLGDNGAARTPRVSLQMIEQYPNIADRQRLSLALCGQRDGLSFAEDGSVPTSATMSEIRYSWMWVVQRPVNRAKFNVRMQVVVFSGRANLYAPIRSEEVFNPVTTVNGTVTTTTGPTFTPGETSILNVPATADLRKGSWVMDATLRTQTLNDVPTPVTISTLRHAEFYRVLSVSDAVNGTVSLEVHKPITRPDGLYSASNPATYRYVGTLVSMPLMIDAFDRTPMTASTGQ